VGFDRSGIEEALRRASTTRQVVVEPGAIARTGEIFSSLTDGRTAVVVADETTFGLAGKVVTSSLETSGIGVQPPVILGNVPALHADYAHVAVVRPALQDAPAGTIPVALGSGTLNDLTKRAAFEIGVPYVVVGTAASMDGYTASGASLVQDGFKTTLPCDAPLAVVADPVLLADAPAPMTASGYGDLAGKVTAGADWLLADALGVDPVQLDIWTMVQDPLHRAIRDPDALRHRDVAAVEQLFLGLVMTGLAIQATGSSRPASGSEHQFSHLQSPLGDAGSGGLAWVQGCVWHALVHVYLRGDSRAKRAGDRLGGRG
jgi:glycerol-1-phosphate dehydrogenase [NAD(P)+]